MRVFQKLKRAIWGDAPAPPVAEAGIKNSKFLPAPAVWPGTNVIIPKRYQEELLKEQDELKRFQMLQSLIEMLCVELQNFDEAIDQIITAREDYHSDGEYKDLSRRRDALKRENLLLKRVRDQVKVDVMKIEVASEAEKEFKEIVEKGSGDADTVKEEPEDVKQQTKPAESLKWSCQFCTAHNDMQVNVCGICSKTTEFKVPAVLLNEGENDSQTDAVESDEARTEEKMEVSA